MSSPITEKRNIDLFTSSPSGHPMITDKVEQVLKYLDFSPLKCWVGGTNPIKGHIAVDVLYDLATPKTEVDDMWESINDTLLRDLIKKAFEKIGEQVDANKFYLASFYSIRLKTSE
jgi:hypothetical protein